MATTYQFLTFTDPTDMRNASVRKEIRHHAMKAIGRSRRKPRGREKDWILEIRPQAALQDYVDDKALYEPFTRALSCQIDPFGTAAVRIDCTVMGLLQYFVFYSSNYPSNFTFSPGIANIVDSALSDELLINCIMSAAASRARYFGSSHKPFKEKEVSCTQQSLHSLQQRLDHPINHSPEPVERLVNCMLYLGAGAMYRKDLFTAKIHVNAALRTADLIGGVITLKDPQILVRALSLDDLLACIELRPCRINCDYDPGPRKPFASSMNRGLDGNAQFGATGFLMKDDNTLPPPLKTLTVQVLECYEWHRDLQGLRPPFTPEALTVRHWSTLRTLAVRNRLLLLNAASNTMIDLVRISLVTWTLLPPSDMRQIRTAEIIARRMQYALGLEQNTDWGQNQDLRFWCLLIGYFAAHDPSESRTWFAKQICEIVWSAGQKIPVRTDGDILGDLVAFQKRFLFREPALWPHTEKLARYILLKTESRNGRR